MSVTNRECVVTGLPLGSPEAKLAFGAVFGDFIRLIRANEDFQYDQVRIGEKLFADLEMRYHAQAFLSVFGRYRAFLSTLAARGMERELINRQFICPPAGAIITPTWKYKFCCGRLTCPWCRYRQVLELATKPWAPLAQDVVMYRQVHDVTTFRNIEDVRKKAAHDRRLFLRRVNDPCIRFQRIGLELVDGKPCYRLLQALVFNNEVKVFPKAAKLWELNYGRYDCVLEVAMRYSAVNILSDSTWPLFQDMLFLGRVRTAESTR